MKYTIAVNLNRITTPWQQDFEKAKAYHAQHGVDITFIFKNVDVKGYVSTPFQYQSIGLRYLITGADALIPDTPTANANMFVFDEYEWATPPGSQYPLQLNTPTGNVMMAHGKPFIQIATSQAEHNNGQTWIQIAHEIMHTLRIEANAAGFPIADVMDTYIDNSNPNSPTGNFAQQWKLLQLFIQSQSVPTVTLTRHPSWKGKETVGHLTTNGFECRTLELPWIDNKNNLSCISPGTYPVKWTYSLKFPLGTYEVQNVQERSGIRFHSGNYAFGLIKDTEGCILVGDSYGDLNKDGVPEIINSKATLKKLNAFFNKKPFTLVVK